MSYIYLIRTDVSGKFVAFGRDTSPRVVEPRVAPGVHEFNLVNPATERTLREARAAAFAAGLRLCSPDAVTVTSDNLL